MSTYLLKLLTITILFHIVSGSETCLDDNGYSGECTKISNCPSAIELLVKEKIRPKICGFNRLEPIVCCKNNNSSENEETFNLSENENEPCSETCLDENGVCGECTKITNCPSAIELVKNKIHPKTCGFDGLVPIVCCKQINLSTENEPFPPGCKDTFQNTFQLVGGGGIKAWATEFPHMAALGFEGQNNEIVWGCGGTLITKQYVLTAAHCLVDKRLGEVKHVRLGDSNLKLNRDDKEPPQNFTVIERIKHPGYKPPAAYNDIAIIKLDKPCQITPYVIPACLHTKYELPNMTYSATGWGQLGFGGELSDQMQNMLIKVFNHTDCEKAYSRYNKRRLPKRIDEKTQICAGAPGIDTCPGDSGGPLQIYETGENTVYGVTSFGVACVISRIPGVYTRVSAYIPWIKSIISSSSIPHPVGDHSSPVWCNHGKQKEGINKKKKIRVF